MGYRGLLKLTEEELDEIYGEDRKYDFSCEHYRNYPEYMSFHTYFDCPIIVMVAKILDLKRRGLIEKTSEEIFEDVRTVIIQNYVHYTPDKVHCIKEYGHYFPTVSKNPSHYIEKREDFKQMLIDLKKLGKKVFLSTNSHADYAELIMTSSIGEDWKDYFDLVCVASMKPAFFKDPTEGPHPPNKFMKVDRNIENYMGAEVTAPDMNDQDVYINGNGADLDAYFARITEKESPKVLYVGDQFITDCVASQVRENWSGLAIVEELNKEANSAGEIGRAHV